METTTTTFNDIPTWEAGIIADKVAKLKKRIADKDLDGSVSLSVSDARPGFQIHRDGSTSKCMVVDVTLTHSGSLALGDFTPVALIDFTSAEEPLVFGLNDVTVADAPDAKRCDHCGVRVARNKVLVVADTDGNQLHLGSTCVKDFLGHDAIRTLIVGTAPGEAGEPTQVPTRAFLDAAASAINAFGFRKSHESGSTKIIANKLVRGLRLDKDEEDRLEEAGPHGFDLDELEAWAREQSGSDFADSMATIARSEWIGDRALGIAAFIPEGFRRDQDRQTERQARQAAEEARKADAEDAPTGRTTITGTVVSVKARDNGFQVVHKMTVVDDRGFKVWGSVPKALDGQTIWGENDVVEIPRVAPGERITFTATVEPSSDDKTFGFFKRPTKAEFVERLEANVAA